MVPEEGEGGDGDGDGDGRLVLGKNDLPVELRLVGGRNLDEEVAHVLKCDLLIGVLASDDGDEFLALGLGIAHVAHLDNGELRGRVAVVHEVVANIVVVPDHGLDTKAGDDTTRQAAAQGGAFLVSLLCLFRRKCAREVNNLGAPESPVILQCLDNGRDQVGVQGPKRFVARKSRGNDNGARGRVRNNVGHVLELRQIADLDRQLAVLAPKLWRNPLVIAHKHSDPSTGIEGSAQNLLPRLSSGAKDEDARITASGRDTNG